MNNSNNEVNNNQSPAKRSHSEGNINIGDASVPSSPSNNITAPPDSLTTTNCGADAGRVDVSSTVSSATDNSTTTTTPPPTVKVVMKLFLLEKHHLLQMPL